MSTPNATLALDRSRLQDYVTLLKPELTLLSSVTAVAGYLLGVQGLEGGGIAHTALGTFLTGGACGALNQYLEREQDALMRRTANRPLPARRIAPAEALLLGLLLAAAGITELWVFLGPLPGFLAVVTLAVYLLAYTPLKKVTAAATLVGGIPGALPPVIGWAAARQSLGPEALLLFALLFFWQMPHFFSLAWIYRKDYARAGYALLSTRDEEGRRTADAAVIFAGALFGLPLLFPAAGLGGGIQVIGGLLLGAGFLAAAIGFRAARTSAAARRVFFLSLFYLPAVLFLLLTTRF